MNHRPFLAIPALLGTLLGGAIAAQAQSQLQPAATYAPAASSAGAAQAPGAAPGTTRHRGNRMNRILETLDLTSQQQATIKGYETSFRAARKTAAPQTRAYLVTEVESALTSAQRRTFETALHARRAPDAATPQGQEIR